MSKNVKAIKRERVKRGIRKKISGTPQRPRLSVYRSDKHIYAQLIDDTQGTTLASASSLEKDLASGTKAEVSVHVGKQIAARAKEAGIETAIFDRNGFRYHGRVKALADSAREGGLKF